MGAVAQRALDDLVGRRAAAAAPAAVEAVESALRYRAQAPLIDEMMKEIGVENPGVSRMGDIFRSARDASSLAKDATAKKKEGDK